MEKRYVAEVISQPITFQLFQKGLLSNIPEEIVFVDVGYGYEDEVIKKSNLPGDFGEYGNTFQAITTWDAVKILSKVNSIGREYLNDSLSKELWDNFSILENTNVNSIENLLKYSLENNFFDKLE